MSQPRDYEGYIDEMGDERHETTDEQLRSVSEVPRTTLDELWHELLWQACSSDGPIRDADVKDAIRIYRPRIEAASDASVAPWMRMKNALAAFEAWAEVVIPMLENAGDYESAAFGKDRIEQSENARTTVNRRPTPPSKKVSGGPR